MAQLKNTTISDTGSLNLPAGTTAQRPASPAAGQIRYNTTINDTEYYDGAAWRPISDSNPEATGGTIVDTDIGGVPYRIHLFTNTGNSTFTVSKGGEVEYLIVAGGGSGAGGIGAGGGAGGLLTGVTVLTPQAYTISVGAGGAPAIGGSGQTGIAGNNGGNSTALGLTAIGGGHGGRHREGFNNGTAGGSGGGAGNNGSRVGGAGTSGQGNKGGDVIIGGGPNWASGGGGGAGQPGQNIQDGRTDPGGNGGAGIALAIEGNWTWYAGGGGGGVHNGAAGAGNGGLGGGGGGSASAGSAGLGGIGRSNGKNGLSGSGTDGGDAGANTGGGGGGGAWDQTFGGAGGSGIVIVRYRRNASTTTQPNETRPSFQPFFYNRDVRPITARTGLVLELDAANPLSYPGTGTTWTDLSGTGNNGTLINNVGYTSQNYGSLTFNGVNTAIHTTQQVSNAFTGNNSLSFWIYFDSDQLTRNCILHSRASGTSLGTGGGSDGTGSTAQINMQTRFTNDLQINLPSSPSSTTVFLSTPMTFNSYSFVTIQWNEQLSLVEGYVNGILQDVNNNAGIDFSAFRNSANSITAIGNNGGDQAFNGKIAKVLIYNRTLSLQEITQNFNATRGRYGI